MPVSSQSVCNWRGDKADHLPPNIGAHGHNQSFVLRVGGVHIRVVLTLTRFLTIAAMEPAAMAGAC